MNLTVAIHRRSVFLFALIPLFAIWGFWFTYVTRPPGTVSALEHVHGIAMFGWCVMLIVQSGLIRSTRRDAHRQVGKFSYLLAPIVVASTLMLANYRLDIRGLTGEGLYLLSLQMAGLVQFVIAYSLAIRYRKSPDVHARYMVVTALPLLDPIFARILAFNFIPVEFTIGIIQYMTFGFADLILIALIASDWKAQRRRDVFLPMLFVMLVTQVPVFFILDSTLWRAFAAWYMQLPLA